MYPRSFLVSIFYIELGALNPTWISGISEYFLFIFQKKIFKYLLARAVNNNGDRQKILLFQINLCSNSIFNDNNTYQRILGIVKYI